MHGSPGALAARRPRTHTCAVESRVCPRAIRDHTPVSRWQRARRQAANHVDSGRRGRAARSLTPLTGLPVPTINTMLDALAHLRIVREITGRKRNRVYRYEAYVKLLSEGTEPL